MDDADLAALAQVGKGLCVVSFRFSHCGAPSLMNLSRLALKVVLQISNACGSEAKVNPCITLYSCILPAQTACGCTTIC